jgi:hypothetical protein
MQGELHVFDHDETLCYAPRALFGVAFGGWSGGYFCPHLMGPAMKAARALKRLGVDPVGERLGIVQGVPTRCLDFDFNGYRQIRDLATRSWQRRNSALRWSFPEGAELVALPALELLTEAQAAGHWVYVCSARGGGQARRIVAELAGLGVTIAQSDVLTVGAIRKSRSVRALWARHQPDLTCFYDDNPAAIADVLEYCADVPGLAVTQYSRAIVGQVEKQKERKP